MSYKVIFRDRTSTVIEQKRGEKLKELLLSPRPPQNIEINGELYRASEVVAVKMAVASEDSIPTVDWQDIPVLPQGNKCQGLYSIQSEINNIAKSDYPQTWAKLIVDKKWRAEVRQKLLDSSEMWCDSKTGVCFCNKK